MSTGDSSSEEDTEKLKEATWSFGPAKSNGCQTEHARNGTQSRRTVASDHENDGNELQTTPEFRAHVAKKLGAVLDGCISEVLTATVESNSTLSGKEKEEDENEGFRLFSTSVPGMSCPSVPAPSLKRRPVPSSSDSDSEMEMRIRQAAVTISDIVRPYYTEKTEEKKETGDAQEDKETGDAQEDKADTCEDLVTQKKKKKKKKKKVPKLDEENENESQDSSHDVNTQRQDSTQETSQPAQLKKKKKKKKKADLLQVHRE
ncbi:hypothetical protein ACEWY4_012262 [Coilia grayii]|uniref:Protein CUSTOS n=1 Tax=Coilia grayii TaxID=363190 RepID=A0ABD1K004_9TELE